MSKAYYIGAARVPAYLISPSHRDEVIDGFQIAVNARAAEKKMAGAGEKLLKEYIPGIEPDHIQWILTKSHYLIGVQVFFLIEREVNNA
jgi:hypothetical protein